MQLLDGKKAAESFLNEIKQEVFKRKELGKKTPHLAALIVGHDPASVTYVSSKVKTCKELGFDSTLLQLDASVSEEDLLAHIREFNERPDIDGILVQLPLPKHISEDRVIATIDPDKDVDGFHPLNVGKMVVGNPSFVSATPKGIMMLLEHYGVETSGKHCVVLGRSNIVGTPISILLSRNSNPGNCTVTLCHSRTTDLAAITRQADLLIAAIGIPHFVKAEMVKEGAVVIDVGINRIGDPSKKSGTRLVGDVDFDAVAPKCSSITPVPGGVGKMTICALMKNTLSAAENK